MTGLVSTMWMVWGALALLFAGLNIYSGKVSQNEDDHLILDDAFSNMRSEQASIVARVNKIAPFKMASLWLFVAATVFVAGYYIFDIVSQFK
jgi:hypothetical protein